MSESGETVRSVTLTRVFDAPLELVYEAWTRAEHVVKWMKCDVSAELEVENWVPEVGVTFETHMWQDGVFDVRGTGRFTEVDPPHLLAYVSDPHEGMGMPEMSVRVEFKDVGGKTEVTLTHTGMPNDQIRSIIEAGWTSSLSQLRAVVEPGGGTAGPAAPEPSVETVS